MVGKIAEKDSSNTSKRTVIILGLVAVVAIFVSAIFILHAAPQEIDGIQCNQMEQAVFHIHAHLDIIINGQKHTIPSQIGIMDDRCLYWLHTHDSSGIIHIEAPQQETFTLGQFMDVWNSTKGITLPNDEPKVFVNGQEVTSSYRDVKLLAHDEIVIIYGTVPPTIPSSYQFPLGL